MVQDQRFVRRQKNISNKVQDKGIMNILRDLAFSTYLKCGTLALPVAVAAPVAVFQQGCFAVMGLEAFDNEEPQEQDYQEMCSLDDLNGQADQDYFDFMNALDTRILVVREDELRGDGTILDTIALYNPTSGCQGELTGLVSMRPYAIGSATPNDQSCALRYDGRMRFPRSDSSLHISDDVVFEREILPAIMYSLGPIVSSDPNCGVGLMLEMGYNGITSIEARDTYSSNIVYSVGAWNAMNMQEVIPVDLIKIGYKPIPLQPCRL